MTSKYRVSPQLPEAPLSVALVGLSTAIFAVVVAANAFDQRLLYGAGVWMKPLKFALSFIALFASIALLELRLSPSWRHGIVLKVTMFLMGASLVAEMGYMLFQAAQGEPSHFNLSTPFHAFMYSVVMFAGALILVAGIGIYGAVAAIDKEANLSPGLRLGVVSGFGLSCVLTLVVAGYLGAQSGHHVGIPSLNAPTLPLLGWSLEVGDLRPAHFLSLHAMQVLPLIGLTLDRFRPAMAVTGVTISAVAYVALTLAVFVQALAGQPLISL